MIYDNYALQVVEQPIRLDGFAKRLVAEGEEYLHARKQDDKPFLLVMPWLMVRLQSCSMTNCTLFIVFSLLYICQLQSVHAMNT